MPPRPWTRLAAALVLTAGPAYSQDGSGAEGSPGSAAEPPPAAAVPAPAVPAPAVTEEPSATPDVSPGGEDVELIQDPELSAVSGAADSTFGGPSEEPARWRLVLHSRFGVDTEWRYASQEVLEGTTIGVVEVEQRVGEGLLLSLGVRGRHALGRRKESGARYELDAMPTAAFADVGLGDAVHLRAGYQIISLGRFDVLSATNVLGVSDLRSGPVTMPDAAHVAQPAMRLDLHASRGLTVQAYYVPFFQPHLIAAYGGDYALFTPLDRAIDEGGTGDPAADEAARVARDTLERAVGRSGLAGLSRESFRLLGPDPSLNEPQGAVRATLHGTPGEVALTVATALERLPAIVMSSRLADYLDDPSLPAPPSLTPDDFRVGYGRYHLAAIDGATDVGPVQVGAEVAYMMDRTLSATTPDLIAGTGPDRPVRTARAEQVDVVQVGLRGEMTPRDDLAFGVEAFAARPLEEPSRAGYGWFGFEGNGWTRGVAAGVQFRPVEGLTVELGGLLASGLTFVGLPRVEWEAATRLYLEIGAAIVEGPAPGPLGTPTTSIGGLYDDTDQVFLGVRWLM